MKVVVAGTYSQAGLGALADATYEQRRAVMDEVYNACGGKTSTISSATVMQILLQSLRFQAVMYIKEC